MKSQSIDNRSKVCLLHRKGCLAFAPTRPFAQCRAPQIRNGALARCQRTSLDVRAGLVSWASLGEAETTRAGGHYKRV
jgi:hypothetical protein